MQVSIRVTIGIIGLVVTGLLFLLFGAIAEGIVLPFTVGGFALRSSGRSW